MARTFTQRLSFKLEPESEGTVYLTADHNLHPDLTSLSLTFPDFVTVDATEGFAQTGKHQWKWNERTQQPWLRLVVDVNRTKTGNYNFVDAGSWALLNYPPIAASWRYTGQDIEREKTYTIEQEGVASSDGNMSFIGRHEEHTFTGGGQKIRLVVPAEASLSDSLTNIRASLSHAADHLSVGSRDDEVLIVAAPSTVNWGPAGLQRGANGCWVLDSSLVGSPGNTWLHEYIHTRQEWERSHSTEWLIEGTTNYYAALLTFQQGRISFSEFYRYITTNQDSGSILVNPGTWTSSNAHYTKGRRVTAALDLEIRKQTDRESTFEDVFRKVNIVDGSLKYEVFEEIVVGIAGRELKSWLETYVTDAGQPEIPKEKELFTPEIVVAPGPVVEITEPEEPEEGTKACPVCRNEVSVTDEYCGTCGTAVFKECPICESRVGSRHYCSSCGYKLIQTCDICGCRPRESDEYCFRCGAEL